MPALGDVDFEAAVKSQLTSKDACKHFANHETNSRHRLTFDQIIGVVAEYYQVNAFELTELSTRGHWTFKSATPRHDLFLSAQRTLHPVRDCQSVGL